jgi:hypothetical protein
MATFRIEHTFSCSAARFWDLFFDADLNTRLYREELGFPAFAVAEQVASDAGIRRVIRATPRLQASAAIRGVLGPAFRYQEDGWFDRASGRYTYQLTPSALADRLRNQGAVHLRPCGDGVVRVAEISLDVKLGALSGPVSGLIRRTTEDGYQRFAAGLNRRMDV